VDRLCAASPVVLVAEDLQWADEASVLVWHRLSRAAAQLPLLLAGSWRDTAADLDYIDRVRPVTGWVALTPTEARVASLVAEGRSNPDIAAELFLSRNTVQTHVSHILAKLEARSRTEIVRAALAHPPARHPASA
jgi:DNA-binding CsgD family transcriptional regulator